MSGPREKCASILASKVVKGRPTADRAELADRFERDEAVARTEWVQTPMQFHTGLPTLEMDGRLSDFFDGEGLPHSKVHSTQVRNHKDSAYFLTKRRGNLRS